MLSFILLHLHIYLVHKLYKDYVINYINIIHIFISNIMIH
jgi:hypothetical protein